MKLKFKNQVYQANAVNAVVACFSGQPKAPVASYRMDPGKQPSTVEFTGFGNVKLALSTVALLHNIQTVQQRQNIPISQGVAKTGICDVNLDVEMETGTGKTYCYIKTLFELHDAYGWSKFIVVVPSVARASKSCRCFSSTRSQNTGFTTNRARSSRANTPRCSGTSIWT